MVRLVTGALIALALMGCSRQSPPAPVAETSSAASSPAAAAKPVEPADKRLAWLYDASCRACHGRAGTGAPVAGDAAAWAPRWSKGLPALVDSAVKGKGGMPAGGQCFACRREDYAALIRFMAGHEGDRP